MILIFRDDWFPHNPSCVEVQIVACEAVAGVSGSDPQQILGPFFHDSLINDDQTNKQSPSNAAKLLGHQVPFPIFL